MNVVLILKYNCYKNGARCNQIPIPCYWENCGYKKGVNGDERLTHPSKKENGNGIYQNGFCAKFI